MLKKLSGIKSQAFIIMVLLAFMLVFLEISWISGQEIMGSEDEFRNQDNSDNIHLLHKASFDGDISKVRRLVHMGYDPDQLLDECYTPLMAAVYNGHDHIVRCLLGSGADINQQAGTCDLGDLYIGYNSALMIAIRNDNDDLAKYLIDKGADMHLKDGHGKSTLSIAVEMNNFDIVKYMIDNGANVNIQDEGRLSPLILAVADGYYQIVRYLIDNGAQIVIHTNHGKYSALLTAAYTHQLLILKYLIINGADINFTDDLYGKSALMCAADAGDFQIVRYLVQKGADVHLMDKQGNQAIDYARQRGYSNIVNFLNQVMQ